MDAPQIYMSYTVLAIVSCSITIVALNFATGSTSRQIALIDELKTSVDRARKICERARSAALWTASDTGPFGGMSSLLSFPLDPRENDFVNKANQLIEALGSSTADRGDLGVSSLRRQISKVRRIEEDGNALLSALEMRKQPVPIEARQEADQVGRFQRLAATQ